MKDAVLRALITVKCGGEEFPQVKPCVRTDDGYLIVLESEDTPEGQRVIEAIPVPAEVMDVVTDAGKEYELVCRRLIDFDEATITDVPEITQERFQPPP